MQRKHAYDVALSYATENRELAQALALELKRRGVAVFYDRLEQADLWGKDLYQHLSDVYRFRARFCLIFVSAAYARRSWTRLELSSAQERALQSQHEYILPIRLDETELPGLPSTIAYVDGRQRSVEEIVDLVQQKLGSLTTRHSVTNGKCQPLAPERNGDLLYWKILSAVNAFDPMDLLPYAPPEEYGEECRAIAALLPQANSVRQLAGGIRRVFAGWFSPAQAGPVKSYLKLAHELWLLTRSADSPRGRQTAGD
ncbi:MAG: toll/interleukin-1 receptor domain-containing protein [Symbiobacteriia bacterium]